MGEEIRLELRGECLWADCREADERELAQVCRALAVSCIEKDVKRVLIDATQCDPEGVGAVRDAFTMMMLAGIPSGFRAAFVTDVRRAYAYFADLERDLTLLHVQAKVFADTGAASDWLASAARSGAPAERTLPSGAT